MPSEHLATQVALYAAVAVMYVATGLYAVRAGSRFQQWFGLCFLLAFLENVIAFPMALAGYSPYEWMLGLPETTLYLSIVLVGMVSTWGAFKLFSRQTNLPWLLNRVPPLWLHERSASRISFVASMSGALLAIVMSTSGYFGYYMTDVYTYEPPLWLDFMRSAVAFCIGLSFVVFFSMLSKLGRVTHSGWTLALLWSFAGILSAFKTYVVLPFFLMFLAAWLTSRVRVVHLAAVAGAVLLAYMVVEPMRDVRNQTGADNALTGLEIVVREDLVGPAERGILERFVKRIDYTGTAVEVLRADRFGAAERYRERLRETYASIPVLAFVPAALWPGKPLADLGRELSITLTGNPRNSVTPSNVVASYLWLGFFGVVLNSFVGTYFVVLAARILQTYLSQPLIYIPLVFLLLTFSIQTSIMAYHYISILRALAMVAGFYFVAPIFGLKFDRRRLQHQGMKPRLDSESSGDGIAHSN